MSRLEFSPPLPFPFPSAAPFDALLATFNEDQQRKRHDYPPVRVAHIFGFRLGDGAAAARRANELHVVDQHRRGGDLNVVFGWVCGEGGILRT